ncbi:hypothetical protein ACE10Z_36310 [Bradyrhizobium sp. Pha-3]|uniref:hypothetical protein n=1 Tax=Bradyrhizobium sp. Pha-3 TaxID=208375 RepID=UPI0035D52B65
MNADNSLGVGTSQLYAKTAIYNYKRYGEFRLGNRTFAFRVKRRFGLDPRGKFNARWSRPIRNLSAYLGIALKEADRPLPGAAGLRSYD